jgi:hypothetical protein
MYYHSLVVYFSSLPARILRRQVLFLTFLLTSGALANPTLTVVSVAPPAGSTNVSIGTVITATFSEAIDPTTLTTSSFTVQTAANTPVPGTISYNTTNFTATFVPNSSLLSGTTYIATLSTNVADPLGDSLATNYVWSFTCGVLFEPNIGPVILSNSDDGSTAEIPLPFPVSV